LSILCIANNFQILTVPTIVQLYYIANWSPPRGTW